MRKRSTLLVAIGLAVFVLGAGVVVVALRNRSGSAPAKTEATAVSRTSAVVVATADLSEGTTGESLIASKTVALQSVPAAEYSADDLTSLGALDQETLNRPIAAGQPIEASDLSVDAGVLAPPKGDESMALTLSGGASGLAGYLQPGSDVDIYADVAKAGSSGAASLAVPCVTLVESSVEVLDVSDEVPAYVSDPTAAGRTVPSSLTLLVAVTPAEALKLVYYTVNEQLYLTETAQSNASVDGVCSRIASSTNLVAAS